MAKVSVKQQWAPPEKFLRSIKVLMTGHLKSDKQLEAIYLSPDSSYKEIRLIEVTPQVGYTGEAFPLGFSASPAYGVDFPSSIMLLNPQEWEEYRLGKLALPAGWKKSSEDLIRIWPST